MNSAHRYLRNSHKQAILIQFFVSI